MNNKILYIKGSFTPTLFGPDFLTFQFDLNQNCMCETSPGPRNRPNNQILVQQKEVVSVQINLNHGSGLFLMWKHFWGVLDFLNN